MKLSEQRLRKMIREEISSLVERKIDVEMIDIKSRHKPTINALAKEIVKIAGRKMPDNWKASAEVVEFEAPEVSIHFYDPEANPGDRTLFGFTIAYDEGNGKFTSMPSEGWTRRFDELEDAVRHSIKELGL